MAYTTKRKSSENLSSRSTDKLNEVEQGVLSRNKRIRISSAKTENESSTDSFSHSNFIPSDSEGSSDSEFEEHAYSRPTSKCSKGLHHSRPRSKLKSYINFDMSELGRHTGSKDGRTTNKRSRCTSKNAVMARLNREKKKKYIEDLEVKNAELEAENQLLKNMLEVRVKEVESLKRKTLNLENVIRNSTEIGSLLKCVSNHTDLKISSSLLRSGPNCSLNAEVNAHTEKPSSRTSRELESSPTEDEGNEILNFNSKSGPVSSPFGFLDINDDVHGEFDIFNPLLSDVDSNWFKPSRFEFPESPESTGCNGLSPSRCETPSKGFDACANKGILFGDVGVCFHIANKKVSLEFCDSCNHMASL